MFNTAVKEDNIAKAKLTIEEKAELTTWLLTCYDIYCDYEVIVGRRTYYERSPGDFTDYQKDIISSLKFEKELLWTITNQYLKQQFNNLELVTSTYPGHYSYTKEDDIKVMLKLLDFVTTHFTTGDEVLTGVYMNYAILSQVLKKRQHLIDGIFRHFKDETEDIIIFLTGHHWRRLYSPFYEMEADLYHKKAEIVNIDTLEEKQPAFFLEGMVEEDYQQLDFFKKTSQDFLVEFEPKLQELREKYSVSIEFPGEIKDVRNSGILPSLQMWISKKMPHLHNI